MSIFHLPTELFQLVADELEREDINSLSQVSHALRVYCEPVIFHRITLSDDNKRAVRINNRILERVEDPQDHLTQHVRHITVGYTSVETTLPEKLLSKAIQNLKLLKSFTWRTWFPVPPEVLQALQEAHPSTSLIVIAHERNNLALDQPLISSPQLHTLDIKLCALYDKNFHQPKGKSELGLLKRLIMQGGSLKVLRLKFAKIKHGSRAARNAFQGYGPSEVDPVAFKFDEGEILPALEELAVRDMFEWAGSPMAVADSGRTWNSHQDWSRLHTLDCRLKHSEIFLQCLIGSVPLLQTLKILLRAEIVALPVTSSTLYHFLSSTPHLTHLHIENNNSVSTTVLQVVGDTVGTGLRSFYLQMDDSLTTWRDDDFMVLLTDFPILQALALDGPYHQVFGAWTCAETELPLDMKLANLVRTTREYLSPRRFATRHSRYCWHDSGSYIKYPGQGRLFTYYVPTPPWLGFTETKTDEEAARRMSSTRQLLEMFGLATEALQRYGRFSSYPGMDP